MLFLVALVDVRALWKDEEDARRHGDRPIRPGWRCPREAGGGGHLERLPRLPNRVLGQLEEDLGALGYRVQAQKAAVCAWAERHGVRVVSYFEDRLSGGTTVEDR